MKSELIILQRLGNRPISVKFNYCSDTGHLNTVVLRIDDEKPVVAQLFPTSAFLKIIISELN